jgi:hypothetical protein
MESLKNPITIFGLPLLLITLHVVALATKTYEVIGFFDSIMHFFGGFICALSVTGMLAYAQDRVWIRVDDRNVFRPRNLGALPSLARHHHRPPGGARLPRSQ